MSLTKQFPALQVIAQLMVVGVHGAVGAVVINIRHFLTLDLGLVIILHPSMEVLLAKEMLEKIIFVFGKKSSSAYLITHNKES
jgi:hypothetical protein